MHARRKDSRGREGGFTIVEVIVAIMVLTFGVMGLAGTTGYIVRQVTLGQMANERAAALQSVVEELRSSAFSGIGTGSTTVGNYACNWWVDEEYTQSKVVKIVTVGPGINTASGFPVLRPNVADTFTYRVLNY